MANWLLIVGIMVMVFVAKCIKELADVRAMGRMVPQERKAVIEKRNFYIQENFESVLAIP